MYMCETAILRDFAERANVVLTVIELGAVRCELKVNRGKCQAVIMGEAGADIRIEDGTGMAQPAAAK